MRYGHGCRITRSAWCCQNPPPSSAATRRLNSRPFSMRGPSTASTAGSTTTAATAASPTTATPAYANDRRYANGKINSASSEIITVIALNTTVRPAVCMLRADRDARRLTLRELLAVARHDEQRVVDREPEAEPGREVQREDRHLGRRRDELQREQRADDRDHADHERQARGDDAAEHEQQRDRGERRGDDLRALDVLLRSRAHLARHLGQPGDVGAEHVGALGELGRQALGGLDPFTEVAVAACR